jgi:hypothetical protein
MADVANAPAPATGGSASGKLVEYDLSEAVQRLRRVRFAEYCLIFIGLALALQDFLSPFIGKLIYGVFVVPDELVPDIALTAFGIVAYLSSGKLKSRLWPSYFWMLPLAALAAVWTGVVKFQLFSQFAAIPDSRLTFLQRQGEMGLLFAGLYSFALAAAMVVGVIGLSQLRAARLTPSTHKVLDLLSLAEGVRREVSAGRVKGEPINRARGIVFLVLGVAVFALIGPPNVFAPVPALISLGGFILLIKSRQYFQVSADSLLAADRRQPILFLRAFVDDPSMAVQATTAQIIKLVDFSVETRLANHFMDFGPFIAVGSPRDNVPVPGAARVQLSDDQWQQWVTERMGTSGIIVMYAGVTHWVGWELSQVVEAGMTRKLILLFPSPVAPKGTKRKKKQLAALLAEDLTNRLARVKATFTGTRWQAAWEQVSAPETLIAAHLDETGAVTLFRSKRRNNDAFQIAVEITHLSILGRLPPQLAA